MREPWKNWVGGLADWVDGDTAYLSIAFTWKLDAAYQKAVWYKAQGLRVIAGGPGLFTRKHYLADVAELGGDLPDAVTRHNPYATFASRGCSVGCWFCIVPKMEGREYTMLPDFPVRPVLCDNNLSDLPADYQNHIIQRYIDEDVPLLDANSGFEPRTFTEDVFQRWRAINRGVWRFAYDDQDDSSHVERVMHMLREIPTGKKRVYVLIGNEPVGSCLDRIYKVMAWGGEPWAQPYIKLNALEKKPHVRFDWTLSQLRDVQRWTNNYRFWRGTKFDDYLGSRHARPQLVGQGALL
tara:strand:- start:6181 stop:7065 length:885 start_codon:yes stop_codon:yes gene_type:complete